MKVKALFSVPEGKRITEKYLYRVLISSVCSILLCMSCLIGTTWAWFTVSIENTENVIEIGTPSVVVSVDGVGFTSGNTLPGGEQHTIHVSHDNDGDALNQKSTLYVTFSVYNSVDDSVDNMVTGYVTLNSANSNTVITIKTDENSMTPVSWVVSWFKPSSAGPLDNNNTIDLRIPEEANPTAEPTNSTDSSAGETGSSEVLVEPTKEPVSPTDPLEGETGSSDVPAESAGGETSSTDVSNGSTEEDADSTEKSSESMENETSTAESEA